MKRMLSALCLLSLLAACAPTQTAMDTTRTETGMVVSNYQQPDVSGMEIETQDGNRWVIEGLAMSIGTQVQVTFNTAGTPAVEDDTIIAVNIVIN